MRSSSHPLLGVGAILAVIAGSALPAAASAQQPAPGFVVERLALAPPGSAWIVMDDLRQDGGLGGAASFAVGYARRPLVVHGRDGTSLAVIEDRAAATIGLAVTYHRIRVQAQLTSPVLVGGRSGTVDGWRLQAPRIDLQQRPDTLEDVQLGVAVRLVGAATDPWRLGVDLRLFVPSGARSDYETDDRARGMARVVVAGDRGGWEYAAHAGVHLRSLDDPSPGGPRGSELLVGLAASARLPVGPGALRVGPELSAASALRDLLGADATAAEALLSARWGLDASPAPPLRVKLGLGAGLHARFGAPDWRAVLQVETQGRLD